MTAGTIAARGDLGFDHVVQRGSGDTTLLLLRAIGGDEHQLVALGRQLAPGATLLSPRGKVLEDDVTRRFFARCSVFELDLPDLLARTDEPDEPPALNGTGVLIAAGSRDPYVEHGKPERLAEVLRAGGARVTVHAADAGHELTDADLAAKEQWPAASAGRDRR
ncbi:MAG: alpha/beta hydrolase [Solirubrobacteraceae bacterium]